MGLRKAPPSETNFSFFSFFYLSRGRVVMNKQKVRALGIKSHFAHSRPKSQFYHLQDGERIRLET